MGNLGVSVCDMLGYQPPVKAHVDLGKSGIKTDAAKFKVHWARATPLSFLTHFSVQSLCGLDPMPVRQLGKCLYFYAI